MKHLLSFLFTILISSPSFSQDVTYSSGVRLGLGVTPISALSIEASTDREGGIALGPDVAIYREGSNRLKLLAAVNASWLDTQSATKILTSHKADVIDRDGSTLNFASGQLWGATLFHAGNPSSPAVLIDETGVLAPLNNGGAHPPVSCEPFTVFVDTDPDDDGPGEPGEHCKTTSNPAFCVCTAVDTWETINGS